MRGQEVWPNRYGKIHKVREMIREKLCGIYACVHCACTAMATGVPVIVYLGCYVTRVERVSRTSVSVRPSGPRLSRRL